MGLLGNDQRQFLLLISFWNHNSDARKGARMAMTVTGLGGLALLAGVVLIGNIVGSYDLTAVLNSGDLLREHAAYPVIVILVLLGAFTKSAQFPFHFWLPYAMAAPTPVALTCTQPPWLRQACS